MNKPMPKMASDLHRVGGGYAVQFSTSARGIECVWSPTRPSPRDLRRKVDMRRYEAARDAFVAELSAVMRLPVAVVIVGGGDDD